MNKLSESIILIILAVSAMSCSSTKSSSKSAFSGVAIMQVDEPIAGVCDNSRVIAILPFPGNSQVKAKAPMSEQEIEDQLNSEVTYLKGKTDYSDKGMVNLIVNCNGEMVRCEIDNETKSPELDSQIVAVFAELEEWEPGTVNGKAVDTAVLYSFTIENGRIRL